MGTPFQFGKMEDEMDGGDGCAVLGMYLMPLKRTLKSG